MRGALRREREDEGMEETHMWMTPKQSSMAKEREAENRTLGGKLEPVKGVAYWRDPSMLPGANEGKGRDLKIQERVARAGRNRWGGWEEELLWPYTGQCWKGPQKIRGRVRRESIPGVRVNAIHSQIETVIEPG